MALSKPRLSRVAHLKGIGVCRGDITDFVLMEGRGFGFVTYADPASAQAMLEVRSQC